LYSFFTSRSSTVGTQEKHIQQLHQQLQRFDTRLSNMSSFFQALEGDLKLLSHEIQALNDASSTINVELKNRKVQRKEEKGKEEEEIETILILQAMDNLTRSYIEETIVEPSFIK
jgi:chromosome segregation ATPase